MRIIVFICFIFLSTLIWGQDGSPDLTFGNNGIVLTDLGAEGGEEFYAAAENSMGRILVVGAFYPFSGEPEKFILSYLADGNLDSGFGDNGILRSDIIDDLLYSDIKIQSEDKMLIQLSGYNTPTLVYRYFSDGSLDTNFGNNGSIELFDSNFYSRSLNVTESGNIMAVSIGLIASEYQIWMKRFLPDGIPDPSFGVNGEMFFPVAESSSVTFSDLALLEDEGFYILYRFSQNDINSFKLLKFLPNGNIDQNYGEAGVSQVPIEDYYNGCSCLSFEDESILVSCNYFDFDVNEFQKIIKLTPEGNLDESFGNGFVEGMLGAIVQANQRIIVDNSVTDWEGGTDPYYRRIYNDGNLDLSFVLNSNAESLGSYHLKTLSDGNLLLAGSSIWYNPERYIILQKFINSPLGIEENALNKAFISPNPSNGIFRLHNEELSVVNSAYFIYDILGHRIQEGVVDTQDFNFDLSMFEDGMYFLNINNMTYKLIKN
jgi:uncharacterized delta-60 repeat protein